MDIERRKKVIILNDSTVNADGDFLPLCPMCTKSRWDCDNPFIRYTAVKLNEGEVGELISVRQAEGGFLQVEANDKIINGVEAGIFKSEKEIPMPIVCKWFDPKEPG